MSAAPPVSRLKGHPQVVETSRAQQAVARTMTVAKTTVPHFYVSVDIDATALQLQRLALPARSALPPRPTLTDVLVKAVALALNEHTQLNSSYRDGRIEVYPNINISIAVAAGDAVIAPVIHTADRLSLDEIADRSYELAERVRASRITPGELDGGTFTISNLGMYGVTSFAAVVTPPQAAVLAVGALREQPALAPDGALIVRQLLSLTLSCDHRVLSGHHAAMFLQRLREILGEPGSLF